MSSTDDPLARALDRILARAPSTPPAVPLEGPPVLPVPVRKAPKMASYILRKIDVELWRQVKAKAQAEHTTIKWLIERLLREWLRT